MDQQEIFKALSEKFNPKPRCFVWNNGNFRLLEKPRIRLGEAVSPQGFLGEEITPRQGDYMIAPSDARGVDRKYVEMVRKHLPDGLTFADPVGFENDIYVVAIYRVDSQA